MRPPGALHLDLDLGAEGLGAMRLRASTVAGELHVSLSANDVRVRSTLASHATELRRELESSGLGLTSLDVGGSPTGGHDRTGHAGHHGDNHGDKNSGRHDPASARAAMSSPSARQPGPGAAATSPRPALVGGSMSLDLML